MNSDELTKARNTFKQTIQTYGQINHVLWLQIEPHLSIKTLGKNASLVAFGDTPTMIYFVIRGIFRSYFLDEEGKTYTKNLFFTGNLMGSMPALIGQRPSALQIEALTDAQVLSIPFTIIKTLMRRDPALQAIYIAYLEEHWVIEQEEIERSLVMEDADIRYQRLLAKEPLIDQLIPGYLIADHLGITPTQFSRIRKKLKSQHM